MYPRSPSPFIKVECIIVKYLDGLFHSHKKASFTGFEVTLPDHVGYI